MMVDAKEPVWDDLVLVGTIARPHGLRGQVFVNPVTDFPEERFTVGASFFTQSAGEVSVLRIESVRFQSGRPVIGFVDCGTIEQAETLAGRELRIREDALQPLSEGAYYHHQLVGCGVVTQDGAVLGTVARVEGAGGSLLVVKGSAGEVLIPLAEDIAKVDIAARRITVAPIEGLLDLNVPAKAGTYERRRSG
jgi:16S rRNA processing protein RimM